ncbi:hypothetical protein IMX26_07560 [Clostridium sp. 'deep sea']|uniref:hypothetical protein n=1 Tax=Clostridium sp. 'deep sea' TaxID=2779445 RepID=UPI0018964793|nr:hypothetical protein [Clostridium sp. 'deep sea']QOR36653.1 hypothetical protein IMX26_07560 [Clostridium sp. 'deep sea']
MGKNKRVKASLTEILARKQQGELNKLRIKTYFSKTLNMEIEIKKIPLNQFMEIAENNENLGSIEGMNRLLYHMCPMFCNAPADEVKQALQLYNVGEATDLPSVMLEDNIGEMADIVNIANSFYGLEQLEDLVKNV